MSYQGLEELKLIDQNLKNYNEKIVDFFVDKVNQKTVSVLDFGAGIGTLTEIFFKKNFNKARML